MTTRKSIVAQAVKEATDRGEIYFLGNSVGVVDVPGEPSRVWVTDRNGNVSKVWNVNVPSIPRLAVYVKVVDKRLQVTEQWPVYQNFIYPKVPSHHYLHEWSPTGSDIVRTWGDVFMPWKVEPQGAFVIRVYRSAVRAGASWDDVSTEDFDLDALGFRPGADGRYVLLSVSSLGVITITPGSIVAAPTVTDIPAVPAGDRPIYAVKLYAGQTELSYNPSVSDFVDLRHLQPPPAIGAGDLPTFTPTRILITDGSGVIGTDNDLIWDSVNNCFYMGDAAAYGVLYQAAIGGGSSNELISNTYSPVYGAFAFGTSISPSFKGFRARGTSTSPLPVLIGDTLNKFRGAGQYDTTLHHWSNTVAEIMLKADENFSATNQGTRIEFWSTPTGSTTEALSATLRPTSLDLPAGSAFTINGGALPYVPTSRTVNGKALSGDIVLGLASSDFANQGTTTAVLHGNAAGNPSFGAVALSDMANVATGTVFYRKTALAGAPEVQTLATLKTDLGSMPAAAHDIVGALHTVAGAAGQLVGLTALNTLGLVSPAPALLGPGSAQYQYVTVGAGAGFAPSYSDNYYRGTTGGTLWADVTTGKTLKLIAADNYNLTIPASGQPLVAGVGATVAGYIPFYSTNTGSVSSDPLLTWNNADKRLIIGGLYTIPGNITTNNVIVFDGDSLTTGTGGTYPYPHWMTLTDTYTQYNVAVVGKKISQLKTDAYGLVDPKFNRLAGLNTVVIWAGTNDTSDYGMDVNATAIAIVNDLAAYCRARRLCGSRVIVVGQTSRQYMDAYKNAINARLLLLWRGFADGYAALGDDANIGADGAFANTTYFDADKVHLKDAGYQIAAAIIQDAVNALPGANPIILPYGTAQNQVLITGASPYAPTWSSLVLSSNPGAAAAILTSAPTTGLLTLAGLTVQRNQNSTTLATIANTTAGTESITGFTLTSDAGAGTGFIYLMNSSYVPAVYAYAANSLSFGSNCVNGFRIIAAGSGSPVQIYSGGYAAANLVATFVGNKLGINTAYPTNAFSLGGDAARFIAMERHTTPNTAGNLLVIDAGGATKWMVSTVSITAAGTGYNVGDVLTLAIPAGGQSATVTVATLVGGAGTGVATVTITTQGSWYTVGTKTTTVAPAGGTGCTINVLTLESATDKAGGDLYLRPGVSTGSAESGVRIYGCVAGASGAVDRTLTLEFQVLGNKIGAFGVTPVVRPSAWDQTAYSTALKTIAALTSAALTDNTGGTSDTTLAAIEATYTQATIRNNFADLAAMVNKIQADILSMKKNDNAMIDDDQALGWKS